jgi:cobalamin-dependent methionine synthase I
LPEIVARAEATALYAGTLGPALCDRINELFHDHDLAVAYFLDTLASAAADDLSDRLAAAYSQALRERGLSRHRTRVLAYSPGYCGWHVSGQSRLFARLVPAEIGITLTDGCMMSPVKSVSGALVAGDVATHRVRPEFPFCAVCVARECRDRMASLRDAGEQT